jgi:hypothetical protein
MSCSTLRRKMNSRCSIVERVYYRSNTGLGLGLDVHHVSPLTIHLCWNMQTGTGCYKNYTEKYVPSVLGSRRYSRLHRPHLRRLQVLDGHYPTFQRVRTKTDTLYLAKYVGSGDPAVGDYKCSRLQPSISFENATCRLTQFDTVYSSAVLNKVVCYFTVSFAYGRYAEILDDPGKGKEVMVEHEYGDIPFFFIPTWSDDGNLVDCKASTVNKLSIPITKCG